MDLLEKAAAGISGMTLDEIAAEYAEEPKSTKPDFSKKKMAQINRERIYQAIENGEFWD